MRKVGTIGYVGISEMSTQNKSNKHIPIAIAAFMGLITLIIVMLTLKYDDTIIKFLLITLPFILILGFWGESIYKRIKNNLEQRKLDKLSNVHFINFKKRVLNFEDFVEFHHGNLLYVIDNIIKNTTEFSQINITDSRIIVYWYEGYKEHLNQFDGTINGLISLNNEFNNILKTYENIYINQPIKEIKKIGINKLQLSDKKSYKLAQDNYIDFVKDCKKFAQNANEDFNGTIYFLNIEFQIIEDL